MKRYFVLLFPLLSLLWGCEKFLDEKSDIKLTIPDNIEDLDALMNNLAIFIDDPRGGEISTDDYYVSEQDFNGLYSQDEQNLYLWKDDVYLEDESNDWLQSYNAIYYCNLVLEKLEELKNKGRISDRVRFNKVKGEALYNRGKAYFHAAQIWCNVYDEITADSDLGLPLRLSSNFNEVSKRANIAETYRQIFQDLINSSKLLPAQSSHPTKPSKPAAFGMLSRAYMAIRDYSKAGLYADSSLQIHPALLDYNLLDENKDYPIEEFSKEVIIEGGIGAVILGQNRLRVSEDLIELYGIHDRRKVINFEQRADGSYLFKGTLSPYVSFSGIATNEMLLNRAESYVRSGKLDLAVDDLNTLLITRYEAGRYIPISRNIGKEQLLDIVLLERRKELLFRGLRWIDIRRLNKEGRGISMTRSWQGNIMKMEPNDPRFTLPIPNTIVIMTGMEQNPR